MSLPHGIVVIKLLSTTVTSWRPSNSGLFILRTCLTPSQIALSKKSDFSVSVPREHNEQERGRTERWFLTRCFFNLPSTLCVGKTSFSSFLLLTLDVFHPLSAGRRSTWTPPSSHSRDWGKRLEATEPVLQDTFLRLLPFCSRFSCRHTCCSLRPSFAKSHGVHTKWSRTVPF